MAIRKPTRTSRTQSAAKSTAKPAARSTAKSAARPRKKTAAPTPVDTYRERAILAARAAHDRRAEDILVLDVRAVCDFADYFVIAEAPTSVRLRGVSDGVEKALHAAGARRLNRHGRDTGWILLDYGDVVVHLFDSAARAHYQLESLWADAPVVKWEAGVPPHAGAKASVTLDPIHARARLCMRGGRRSGSSRKP